MKKENHKRNKSSNPPSPPHLNPSLLPQLPLHHQPPPSPNQPRIPKKQNKNNPPHAPKPPGRKKNRKKSSRCQLKRLCLSIDEEEDPNFVLKKKSPKRPGATLCFAMLCRKKETKDDERLKENVKECKWCKSGCGWIGRFFSGERNEKKKSKSRKNEEKIRSEASHVLNLFLYPSLIIFPYKIFPSILSSTHYGAIRQSSHFGWL